MEVRTMFNLEPKTAPTHFEKLAVEEVAIREEVSRTTMASDKWKFKS
jgi:hypothetical protein